MQRMCCRARRPEGPQALRLTPRAAQRGVDEEEAEEMATDYFYNGMSKEEIETSLRDAFAEARKPTKSQPPPSPPRTRHGPTRYPPSIR